MNFRNVQYFIGVGLPEKEDKLFSFLKEQFHPKNNLSSPAHITLIPPFFYENESDLVQKLNSWSKTQKSFKAHFENVGSFKQAKYGTIFLSPEKGEDFKRLYTGLADSVSQLSPRNRNDFIPHLTIANRAPFEQMDQIKKQLREMQISLDLKVNRIILYKRNTGQSWSRYMEFEFDQTK